MFYTDTVTRVPTGELPLVRAINGDSCDDVDLFICNERVPQGAYISVSGRPMRDEEGNSKGGVIVFRDVTERALADHALTEAFAQGRLEVVDTILHNIGNAINSVSIGVGTIAEELRKNNELRRLQAVARSLEEHRGDWPEYVAADPQGCRVLPLILALASDFEAQSDRISRTVERVSGRVAHIVDIIRTQNSFDLRRRRHGAQGRGSLPVYQRRRQSARRIPPSTGHPPAHRLSGRAAGDLDPGETSCSRRW